MSEMEGSILLCYFSFAHDVFYHLHDTLTHTHTLTLTLTLTTDFNECDTPGYSGCDHNCHNTPGSYTCSCRDGWFLDAGGRRCFGMIHLLGVISQLLMKKD